MNILEIRKNIAALQSERSAIEFQPRCRAAVNALVEGAVDGYRRCGAEHLALQAARVAAGQTADLFPASALPGLLALLLPDSLIAEAVASVPKGLPVAERTARLAAIAAELDRLESAEERIVCDTGADRRIDCRPEVVLAS